jgi:trans-2,3-dihydro-3-hydroxyanthranilate isomerase
MSPFAPDIIPKRPDFKLNLGHLSRGNAMARRAYAVYDVFTAKPLEGNPLAVVFDAEGLDTAVMQAIAGEFNLSETIFVLPPDNVANRARIRIFTPRHELPFAGHPTVGGAVALAERDGRDGAFGLEETVGPVPCVVSRFDGAPFATFTLPRLSQKLPFIQDDGRVAAALGLDASDIGFGGHKVELWSAGVPYVAVPVADVAAAGRARLDERLWMAMMGPVEALSPAAYVYCRGGTFPGSAFHARMFASHLGIPEDPATGSAVAALSGVLVAHERPADGTVRWTIEQGVEMGRASVIRLEADVAAGTMTAGRIGGHAVKVAEGTLIA